jgi:beta-glucosidase
MSWPKGFLWGTGASSTQCEGAAPHSDWIAWERAGRAPTSGDGNGFAHRHAEDFAAYRALGLTHHRLSIEWARIEPEPGRIDQAAVTHYRTVLEAAHAAGITPWICLHHFTLPAWFAASGGFLTPANRTGPWRAHVARVAELFGDLAGGWKPVNEPNAYALLGWLGLGFPPGKADREEFLDALQAIQLAAAEAGAQLRQTGKPVASVHSLAPIVRLDDASRDTADFVDACNWRSWLGLQRSGVLEIPGRAPIERPDLAGNVDLIGFSYYFTLGVRDGSIVPYPDGAPLSPLGYAIHAEGLRMVLDRLHAELPGTPLLISEYGIGTHDDTERATYLTTGLAIAHEAIARGIALRGFFHWTGVDNYEWIHGYHVPFGLLDRERRVRPSAEILRAAALQR